MSTKIEIEDPDRLDLDTMADLCNEIANFLIKYS